MKGKIALGAMAALVVASASFWLVQTRATARAASDSVSMPTCTGGQCCCGHRSDPKGIKNTGRLTLDPNQFVGDVKQAYVFAGQNPALLAQLWCYCGCDKTDGHTSLLDCYRGMHGATCAMCTGEALLAKRMADQGSPVEQIRAAIQRNYGSQQ
jgi:Protein of unknown function with PCYCGC motif